MSVKPDDTLNILHFDCISRYIENKLIGNRIKMFLTHKDGIDTIEDRNE